MAINAAKAILRNGKTVLFICDFQERFAKAMFEFDKVLENSVKLVIFSILFVLTLIYPRTFDNDRII